MNENDIIRNELNYFASHPRAFSVTAVRDFSVEPLDPSKVRKHLLENQSFLHIPGSSSVDELFISRQTLLTFVLSLNVSLAKGNLSQIRYDQFSGLLVSALGLDMSREGLSKTISFAKSFGLIYFNGVNAAVFLSACPAPLLCAN